jgi:hypothetical protein
MFSLVLPKRFLGNHLMMRYRAYSCLIWGFRCRECFIFIAPPGWAAVFYQAMLKNALLSVD